MVKVKILGVELEADLLNPDLMEVYEAAIDAATEEIDQDADGEVGSVGVRRQCNAICGCIDKVFGPGSADKILPGGRNLLDCLDAFEDFCGMYERQLAPVIQRKALKYSAARAQRK